MRVIQRNKQAYFDYTIDDTVQAGIVLLGHEVKSLKFGFGSINEAVVSFSDSELWLINCSIPLYDKTPVVVAQGYDSKRQRKLLVTKKQLAKLYERTKKTGLHIVPLKIIETKGLVKLLIGLGKLKKKIEKRSIIKDRDTKRMMDKEIKKYQ